LLTSRLKTPSQGPVFAVVGDRDVQGPAAVEAVDPGALARLDVFRPLVAVHLSGVRSAVGVDLHGGPVEGHPPPLAILAVRGDDRIALLARSRSSSRLDISSRW
jgi:hypothetical protein